MLSPNKENLHFRVVQAALHQGLQSCIAMYDAHLTAAAFTDSVEFDRLLAFGLLVFAISGDLSCATPMT